MRKLSMKQISLIVSISVFTILFTTVLIILNFTKNSKNADVLKQKTYVGLMLSCSAEDKSWCQTHYDALQRISEDLNLEIVCRGNVAPDESCKDVIRSLIDEGCLVIIAASTDYEPYVVQAAAENPDVYFLNAAGTAEGKNIGSYFGRMYQIRYLSGIVAGTQTKTNSIGYVASFRTDIVNRGINAFALGVRSVNPDAVVHVRFCNSWLDDRTAGEYTEKLISENSADIITTDTDSLAPLECADRHGIWSVGYNCDLSDMFPDSYLTGCVWKWDEYYKEQILSCIQGKFHGKHNWFGYESGIMELVDPGKQKKAGTAYIKPLQEAEERFRTFSADVFYGPVTDSEGTVRIAEGESMSDDEMLNNFDWYVEGVEIG